MDDTDAPPGQDLDLVWGEVNRVRGDSVRAEGAERVEPGDHAEVAGALADDVDDAAALRNMGAHAEATLDSEALGAMRAYTTAWRDRQ